MLPRRAATAEGTLKIIVKSKICRIVNFQAAVVHNKEMYTDTEKPPKKIAFYLLSEKQF